MKSHRHWITEISERVYRDLLLVRTGRADLSTNPADHDKNCARAADADMCCDCSNQRLVDEAVAV